MKNINVSHLSGMPTTVTLEHHQYNWTCGRALLFNSFLTRRHVEEVFNSALASRSCGPILTFMVTYAFGIIPAQLENMISDPNSYSYILHAYRYYAAYLHPWYTTKLYLLTASKYETIAACNPTVICKASLSTIGL